MLSSKMVAGFSCFWAMPGVDQTVLTLSPRDNWQVFRCCVRQAAESSAVAGAWGAWDTCRGVPGRAVRCGWGRPQSVKCCKNSGCKTDVGTQSQQSSYCQGSRFSCVLGGCFFLVWVFFLPAECLGERLHVHIAYPFGTVALAGVPLSSQSLLWPVCV